uniref:Gtp-binding protein sar1 n=1 Tax=Triatoma infestans TaxID=30076 RepID=A0A161MBY5_TRIIF
MGAEYIASLFKASTNFSTLQLNNGGVH